VSVFEDHLWLELAEELHRSEQLDRALELCGELGELLTALRYELALIRLQAITPIPPLERTTT
jgi:hypothetical protein